MPTPVVTAVRLDKIVERNYNQAREKLFDQAKQLLQHEKMADSIRGWCNAILSKQMAQAIDQALRTGAVEVKIEFSTAKAGQALWKKWPSPLRQQVPADLVVMAMEYVLSAEGGFSVRPVDHMFSYSLDLSDPDVVEAEVLEPEEENDEEAPQSLEQVLDSAHSLTGPTEADPFAESSES